MSDQQISFQPKVAVATVFEQVRPLQEQLAQIASILEPIRQLSKLANVFEPMRRMEAQIRDLAKVLAPMHNFQDHLRAVLNRFGALQALDQELSQLSSEFCQRLDQLAAALEPAVTLQDRLAHFANAFEAAQTLREEFLALAQSFERNSQG